MTVVAEDRGESDLRQVVAAGRGARTRFKPIESGRSLADLSKAERRSRSIAPLGRQPKSVKLAGKRMVNSGAMQDLLAALGGHKPRFLRFEAGALKSLQ